MESELHFGDQKIRFDLTQLLRYAATQLRHLVLTDAPVFPAKTSQPNAEQIFSKEFLQFLNQLGIDPLKEAKQLGMYGF